ncbi:MAG: hypothetical protein JSS28_10935 [Proteobacteria bacterium]|nr:hypothetical protein [Pseudomonadota bacterium]
MVRLSQQSYQRRLMATMTVYVVVLLWLWPLARTAEGLWLKLAYSLAPVPPILYAIWLMARRVLAGDELEQRTHLIGLGVAAAAISVFGIVAGFLAASHAFASDWAAAALIWIFPLMIVVYTTARAWAARRYGGGGCEDENLPRSLRFLYLAGVFAAIAAWVYWSKGDADDMGLAAGMAVGMLGGATFFALLHWRRRGNHQ